MFKRELTLVVALFGVLSIALFTGCGDSSSGGGGNGGKTVKHAGAWLLIPDSNNDMNFFIVSKNGTVTQDGFRADPVTYSEPDSDTFQLTITVGFITGVINGSLITNTTGTFEVFPGNMTGTIKKIEDRSACMNMQQVWYMWMANDGGSGSILPAAVDGGFKAELAQVWTSQFEVDAQGNMIDIPIDDPLDITEGVMLCNGTALGDPVVGFFKTNVPGNVSSIRFVSIVNNVSGSYAAEGLYEDDSGSAWPTGTVKFSAN